MTRASVAFVCLAIVALASAGREALADGGADGFARFLAEREIDRERRRVLEEPGPWDEARQRALIRVLQRLAAPAIWDDDKLWQDVAESLPNYRLSKFQDLMPDWVEREVAAKCLLSTTEARTWARGWKGR